MRVWKREVSLECSACWATHVSPSACLLANQTARATLRKPRDLRTSHIQIHGWTWNWSAMTKVASFTATSAKDRKKTEEVHWLKDSAKPWDVASRDLPGSRSRIPAHRTNTYSVLNRSKPAGKPLQPIGGEPFRQNKPGGGGLKRAIPEIEILGYGKLRQGESSGSDCLYITQCFSGHGGCDKGTDREKHTGRCGRGKRRCCWGENERDCSKSALQHIGSSTKIRVWHWFAYLKG